MIIGTKPRLMVINSSVKTLLKKWFTCITLSNKTFTWNVLNTNGECSQEENNNVRLNLPVICGTLSPNKLQIHGKLEMDKLTNKDNNAMRTHSL